MKSIVEGTESEGYLPLSDNPDPALLAELAHSIAPLRPSRPEAFASMPAAGVLGFGHGVPTSVGTRAEVLLELAGIKAAIRTWFDKQPDEVLREASAYSARLTEMWTELKLLEVGDRSYTQIRTMQVTPVIEEIDRQFKFAQSRIAMMRQDIDMATRGG